jgi:hypothetical protein
LSVLDSVVSAFRDGGKDRDLTKAANQAVQIDAQWAHVYSVPKHSGRVRSCVIGSNFDAIQTVGFRPVEPVRSREKRCSCHAVGQ